MNVLVVVERTPGGIEDVSLQALSLARRVAAGDPVHALTVGGGSELADTLGEHGVSTLHVAEHEALAHGLAEDGESIVSQGRDAGVPHNRGNDVEPLRSGTPLLIDIFPAEAGGGYHSDLTRTFSSRESGRVGLLASIGLRCARSFAGTEG